MTCAKAHSSALIRQYSPMAGIGLLAGVVALGLLTTGAVGSRPSGTAANPPPEGQPVAFQAPDMLDAWTSVPATVVMPAGGLQNGATPAAPVPQPAVGPPPPAPIAPVVPAPASPIPLYREASTTYASRSPWYDPPPRPAGAATAPAYAPPPKAAAPTLDVAAPTRAVPSLARALPFVESHWQGLELLPNTPALAKSLGIPADAEGVIVDEATMPADAAGFLAGDLVMSVAQVPTPDLMSFIDATSRVRDRRRVELEVLRKGKSARLVLTALMDRLGTANGETAQTIMAGARAPHDYLGPCTNCHRIGNRAQLAVDQGDQLVKTAPKILAGQKPPHEARGACTACHEVVAVASSLSGSSAPTIIAGQTAPHGDRGACSSCHEILPNPSRRAVP